VTNDVVPFHQVEPVLFNTRDAEIHTRKWKYMHAAFSRRNLLDFEVYMDPNIRLLVRHLQTCATKSEALNFHKWGKKGNCDDRFRD
jgi:benzoate 4-monooxygenase